MVATVGGLLDDPLAGVQRRAVELVVEACTATVWPSTSTVGCPPHSLSEAPPRWGGRGRGRVVVVGGGAGRRRWRCGGVRASGACGRHRGSVVEDTGAAQRGGTRALSAAGASVGWVLVPGGCLPPAKHGRHQDAPRRDRLQAIKAGPTLLVRIRGPHRGGRAVAPPRCVTLPVGSPDPHDVVEACGSWKTACRTVTGNADGRPTGARTPKPCASGLAGGSFRAPGRTGRRTGFPSGNQHCAAPARAASHQRCDFGPRTRPVARRHATLWVLPPAVDGSRRTRVGFHLPRTGITARRHG